MGFFKKSKDNFHQGQQDAAGTQKMAEDYQRQQAAGAKADQIGVEGITRGADPAILGGPSTKPLDADDPMLGPANGVSLETYAEIAKAAQAKGITDEAGMCALAESDFGIAGTDMAAAMAEWTSRMQKSMVVGQQFNKAFMGR